MLAFILAIAIAGCSAAVAQDPPELAALRALAGNLLKRKDLGGASAHCEVTSLSQVNSCSGPDRNEVTYELTGEGVLVSKVFRSLGETGNPVGEYRGAPGREKWKQLLALIAAAQWKEEIGIPRMGPPPGPLESIRVMTLSDGKSVASYSIAGPTPAPISKAFAFPGILAMNVTDTVWELSLAHPVVMERKGHLEFTSDWKYKGPYPFRILLPDSGDQHGCGHTGLKWFLNTSDGEVDWKSAKAGKRKGAGMEWMLNPGKPTSIQLSFPFASPADKGSKTAQLDGLGVLVFVAGSNTSVPVTLFSDQIRF